MSSAQEVQVLILSFFINDNHSYPAQSTNNIAMEHFKHTSKVKKAMERYLVAFIIKVSSQNITYRFVF